MNLTNHAPECDDPDYPYNTLGRCPCCGSTDSYSDGEGGYICVDCSTPF